MNLMNHKFNKKYKRLFKINKSKNKANLIYKMIKMSHSNQKQV